MKACAGSLGFEPADDTGMEIKELFHSGGMMW